MNITSQEWLIKHNEKKNFPISSMKRRSVWKNALDQVHFYGRTAFFKVEAAFEKYNKKKKNNCKDEWHKYKEA